MRPPRVFVTRVHPSNNSTLLGQAITAVNPPDGGSLQVQFTTNAETKGVFYIDKGTDDEERIEYDSVDKATNTLLHITRADPKVHDAEAEVSFGNDPDDDWLADCYETSPDEMVTDIPIEPHLWDQWRRGRRKPGDEQAAEAYVDPDTNEIVSIISPPLGSPAGRDGDFIEKPEQGPPAPTWPASAITFDQDEKGRHFVYRGKVKWNEIGEWLNKLGKTRTGAAAYKVWLQRCQANGTAIGEPRHAMVQAKDDDLDTICSHIFPDVNENHFYKAQVKAFGFLDEPGELSEWSAVFTPAAIVPPMMTALTLDVDQHRTQLKATNPVDSEDPDSSVKVNHADISFQQYQVSSNNSNWTDSATYFREDRETKSLEKTWKSPKGNVPLYARGRNVNRHGWTKSNWLTVGPVSKQTPPVNGVAPTARVDANDRPRHGLEVIGEWWYTTTGGSGGADLGGSGQYADDDVAFFWAYGRTADNEAMTTNVKKLKREKVRYEGKVLYDAHWPGLRKGRWFDVQYEPVDTRNHIGALSPRSTPIKIRQTAKTVPPPTSCKIEGIEGNVELTCVLPLDDDNEGVHQDIAEVKKALYTDSSLTTLFKQDGGMNVSKKFQTKKYSQNYYGKSWTEDSEGNRSQEVRCTTAGNSTPGTGVTPSAASPKRAKAAPRVSGGAVTEDRDIDWTNDASLELSAGGDGAIPFAFRGMGIDVPVLSFWKMTDHVLNLSNAAWGKTDMLIGAHTYSLFIDRPMLAYVWSFVQFKNNGGTNCQFRHAIRFDGGGGALDSDLTSTWCPADGNYRQITNFSKRRLSPSGFGLWVLSWLYQTNTGTSQSFTITDRKAIVMLSYAPTSDGSNQYTDQPTRDAYALIT